MSMRKILLLALFISAPGNRIAATVTAENALLYLDFEKEPGVALMHGAKVRDGRFGKALEFTTAMQYAEVGFSKKLDGVEAISLGGWFFPRRAGEQAFVFRGLPLIEENGNRIFQRQENWVNLLLATDQHGFFMGTINGNGTMPFPHVTVSEVGIGAWHQLVVVKAANGVHKFYHNGRLAHSDENATTGAKAWPFRDTARGEPLRLAMAHGGLIGETWIYGRELEPEEIARDFAAKKDRYHPALDIRPVELRRMNAHPAAGLWNEEITKANWPKVRTRIEKGAREILGAFPLERVPLDPQIISEEDCGTYLRRKVSLQVQAGDRMPAYLLIPKHRTGRVPAIICFYGTTSGSGKETTVGLSGREPGTPPSRNNAFAIDMVEAGFVAFAPDYLRDGERIKPGRRPYDTSDFYNQFPDWSIHGKDIWDTQRGVDYLQSLDFVDLEKIGMTGHSYGGHSTLFTAAFEPRIKVAVANGPVSDFLQHGMHWAVPKGAGSSQSMPNLRPYVLDHTRPLPVTFYEFTALIAPRPLLVGQAVGERRPMEEENCAAVSEVYSALGHPEKVRYRWYAGDHDYPPEARRLAVEWFKRWFTE